MVDEAHTRSLLLAVAALWLTACVPGAGAVQKRAAADLGCPVNDVKVAPLSVSASSDALYEAKGCGKRLEYWVKGRDIHPHHGEWYAPR